MKTQLVLLLCAGLFWTSAHAEVTISNDPTSGMVFIGNTWEPTSPVANLNIADLLLTLAGGNVTVADFTPTTCVGPLIVEDPIVYNLGTNLTLTSCFNLMIYDVIENQGAGGIFLSSSGSVPGSGYLVIGTGVGVIPALTKGTYGMPAAPLPDTSKAVHVGSLGGLTSLSAPFLVAVVGDSAAGQYAQAGLPLDLATGAITAFSGQSIAVGSGFATGCYARIGHGDASIIPPTSGQIDVINENGNLYVQSYSAAAGTYAAIGHMTAEGPLSGAINVTIEGNPGWGHIWVESGGGADARIGHQTLQNAGQDVAGNITVQGRGILTIEGGTCGSCMAEIGHRSASDALVNGQVIVESGAGAALTGGSAGAAARIGHAATMVGLTPLDAAITVAVEGALALFGGADGPASVGHHVVAGAVQQVLADMFIYVHDHLALSGGGGANSSSTLGHQQASGVIAVGSGSISCFAGGPLSLTGGSHSAAESVVGHTTQITTGPLTAVCGGSVTLIAGQAESRIDAEGQVSVTAGDSIHIQGSGVAAARVRSFTHTIELKAKNTIHQESAVPGMTTIEPSLSAFMTAGEDITLAESFFPQNGVTLQVIELDADHSFLGGDLWLPPGYFSFFLPNLFDLTPLAGPSPAFPDDGAGAFLSPFSSFLPACVDLVILSSCNEAGTGTPSVLEIGAGLMLDPSFVTGHLQVGDKVVASDSSQAKRQSYNDVVVHDVTFSLDSVFLKACSDVHLWNTDLTTTGPIVLVADNKFPNGGTSFGPGVFTSDNVQLTTGPGDAIRIYSATQAQNAGAGGITSSTFNGVTYVSCTSSCTYETWNTYYNTGAAAAGSHMLFYKDSPVLALDALDVSFTCDEDQLHAAVVIDGDAGEYHLVFESLVSGSWEPFDEHFLDIPVFRQTFCTTLVLSRPTGNVVRLKVTDITGQVRMSTLKAVSCSQDISLTVGPSPARHVVHVHSQEQVVFRLADGLGRLITTHDIGVGRNDIDVSGLPVGIYYYTAVSASGSESVGSLVLVD